MFISFGRVGFPDMTFLKFCFLFSVKKLDVQAHQKLCMLTVVPYGIFLNNEISHKLLCHVSEKRHNDVFKDEINL